MQGNEPLALCQALVRRRLDLCASVVNVVKQSRARAEQESLALSINYSFFSVSLAVQAGGCAVVVAFAGSGAPAFAEESDDAEGKVEAQSIVHMCNTYSYAALTTSGVGNQRHVTCHFRRPWRCHEYKPGMSVHAFPVLLEGNAQNISKPWCRASSPRIAE